MVEQYFNISWSTRCCLVQVLHTGRWHNTWLILRRENVFLDYIKKIITFTFKKNYVTLKKKKKINIFKIIIVFFCQLPAILQITAAAQEVSFTIALS